MHYMNRTEPIYPVMEGEIVQLRETLEEIRRSCWLILPVPFLCRRALRILDRIKQESTPPPNEDDGVIVDFPAHQRTAG